MALVTLDHVSIRFRGPQLLDSVSCRIEPGERIGLLGRNGAGKTTLLRLLNGDLEPDHGQLRWSPDQKVALLPQDVPANLSGTIAEVVSAGAPRADDAESNWKCEHQVQRILSRMGLDPNARVELLSSGMKRRVLLARTLAPEPALLLLDEPTNHLDIDAITWLEGFLSKWSGTFMFVTHDRMFLRHLASRILEIDRGELFDWSCNYETFLKRKEEALAAQEKQQALFDKKLAEEEVWIRQGIRARRTRNEGRVRALLDLRRQRQQRQAAPGQLQLRIQDAQRSGVLVAEVEDLGFAYESQTIVEGFSTTLLRGDKVGVIGPNGVGKSTLLRLLLGQLQPHRGRVRLGSNLQIAYFDQLRQQLDEDQTVYHNVGDGYDTVEVGDRRQHVIGYLQRYLFSPERARTLVKHLSGGERNRVLLARLFAKPANVIVLDEPTNDLDADTLELLEEQLVSFPGTILVVSHDREFLNNVVSSTIVFEPQGVREYVGGFDDWLRQRSEQDAPLTTQAVVALAQRNARGETNGKNTAGPGENARRKLRYREQQELAALPREIEELEGQIEQTHQAMADPAFYQRPGDQIAAEQRRLQQLEEQLARSYSRWEELEALA